MKEKVVKVDHYSAAIANKAGEGAQVLGVLKDSGVNFIALWAYPSVGGKAQLEMIPGEWRRLGESGQEGWTGDGQKTDRILCERRGSAGRRGRVARKACSGKDQRWRGAGTVWRRRPLWGDHFPSPERRPKSGEGVGRFLKAEAQ